METWRNYINNVLFVIGLALLAVAIFSCGDNVEKPVVDADVVIDATNTVFDFDAAVPSTDASTCDASLDAACVPNNEHDNHCHQR